MPAPAQHPAIETAAIFEGCGRRSEIAAFLLAYSIENRARGFVIGAVAGAAVMFAAAAYLKYREMGGK